MYSPRRLLSEKAQDKMLTYIDNKELLDYYSEWEAFSIRIFEYMDSKNMSYFEMRNRIHSYDFNDFPEMLTIFNKSFQHAQNNDKEFVLCFKNLLLQKYYEIKNSRIQLEEENRLLFLRIKTYIY